MTDGDPADANEEGNLVALRLRAAADISRFFDVPPILVGGAAQSWWLGRIHEATDIDMVPGPSPAEETRLKQAGFQRFGRHWLREGGDYGVEFPGSGSDIRRVVQVETPAGPVTIISKEDLYLDRLRQTTMDESLTSIPAREASALIVAFRNIMDWPYVERRIIEIQTEEWRRLGERMELMHTKLFEEAAPPGRDTPHPDGLGIE